MRITLVAIIKLIIYARKEVKAICGLSGHHWSYRAMLWLRSSNSISETLLLEKRECLTETVFGKCFDISLVGAFEVAFHPIFQKSHDPESALFTAALKSRA